MNSRPCRGCGAEIFFGTLPSGKTAPLEITGHEIQLEGGPWYMVVEEGGKLRALPLKLVYKAHWQACPARDQFKKEKQATR